MDVSGGGASVYGALWAAMALALLTKGLIGVPMREIARVQDRVIASRR
jgi:hypothetical protein